MTSKPIASRLIKWRGRRREIACAFALALPLVMIGLPVLSTAASPTSSVSVHADRPWLDKRLRPGERAELLLRAMTQQAKLTLVFAYFGSPMAEWHYLPPAEALPGSAGFVPGIPPLGLPAQWETDAGLGVATQRTSSDSLRERTALPSGLATAATWNTELAQRTATMIGFEARASGFDVLLGPGADLVRDPRCGRNFEYGGEDPLLAGTIAGAEIRGIQSQHIIAVLKHFALNNQETGREVLSADIPRGAARESDLLAFEIAIEQGRPGALMCAYNRVNGVYSCENRWLLTDVLKRDWDFEGYVMSDWGAVHSTVGSAVGGLDQESAHLFDHKPYFGAALKQAIVSGRVSESRLDDMVRRILHSMFAVGLVDHPVSGTGLTIDLAADRKVSEADEEQGIVLLKNAGNELPLTHTVGRLLVIGGHADRGVISGGGSSTVYPMGGNAAPGEAPQEWPGPVVYLPSSPLGAIMGQAPQSGIRYLDGGDITAAVREAKVADRVIVFATQWAAETEDVPLGLAGNQDQLIAAVATANPHTVVVLETAGPVLMPWLDKVGAVLEAWFPGSGGGEAIAKVLFGAIDPSGHLPVTFPRSLAQLPHPVLSGAGMPSTKPFDVDYSEGAAAGYKWFERQGLTPLFPFGYGLSYTPFRLSRLRAHLDGGQLAVTFTVTNEGTRDGAAVAQVYVGPKAGGWEAPRRLGGWSKVVLPPGDSAAVSVEVDPRLLATFDEQAKQWERRAGTYEVWLGQSSTDLSLETRVRLPRWTRSAAATSHRDALQPNPRRHAS